MYTLNGVEFSDEMHSMALGVIAKARNESRKAGFSESSAGNWIAIEMREAFGLPDDGFDYVHGCLVEQAAMARKEKANGSRNDSEREAAPTSSKDERISLLHKKIEELRGEIENLKNTPEKYLGDYVGVHVNSNDSWQVRQRRGTRISICTVPDIDFANKIAERIDRMVAEEKAMEADDNA